MTGGHRRPIENDADNAQPPRLRSPVAGGAHDLPSSTDEDRGNRARVPRRHVLRRPAIVEFVTIDYGDPSSYEDDWGGPTLIGVLAVQPPGCHRSWGDAL